MKSVELLLKYMQDWNFVMKTGTMREREPVSRKVEAHNSSSDFPSDIPFNLPLVTAISAVS